MPADVPVEPITDEPPAVPDDIEQIARQLAVRLDAGGSRSALELLEASLGLLADHPDALDLKIAAAAMTEMREAFEVFGPYEDVPKVTVFGSARTRQDDPVYDQARQIAAALAQRGMDGRHRRRPGDHAGGDGGRRPGAQHRRGHPAAVRAGRQPGHRRRREVRAA